MTKAYDNWERLVRATLRKQELWQLCHDHSRTTSDGSSSTTSGPSPGSSSPIPDVLAPRISTTRVSLLNDQNRSAGAEFKNDKSIMRRKKSRIRLDRWILTRWLSNTFSSTKVTDA